MPTISYFRLKAPDFRGLLILFKIILNGGKTMDLMEILKALFGDEALTFEQFAEKVDNKVIFPCQTLAMVRVTV